MFIISCSLSAVQSQLFNLSCSIQLFNPAVQSPLFNSDVQFSCSNLAVQCSISAVQLQIFNLSYSIWERDFGRLKHFLKAYFWYFLLPIISFRIQNFLFHFKAKQAKLIIFFSISLCSFSLPFRFILLWSEMRGHPRRKSIIPIYSAGMKATLPISRANMNATLPMYIQCQYDVQPTYIQCQYEGYSTYISSARRKATLTISKMQCKCED